MYKKTQTLFLQAKVSELPSTCSSVRYLLTFETPQPIILCSVSMSLFVSFRFHGWVNELRSYTKLFAFLLHVLFWQGLEPCVETLTVCAKRSNAHTGHLVASTQRFNNKCIVKPSNSNLAH
jgi:hypothetical protein